MDNSVVVAVGEWCIRGLNGNGKDTIKIFKNPITGFAYKVGNIPISL